MFISSSFEVGVKNSEDKEDGANSTAIIARIVVTEAFVEKILKEAVAKLDSRLSAISVSQTATKDQLSAESASQFNQLKSEIVKLKFEIEEKDTIIAALQSTLDVQIKATDSTNQRLLELEVRDRRLNLILHVLTKEKHGETLQANFEEVMKNNLGLEDSPKITRLFRIKQRLDNVSVRASNSTKKAAPPVMFSCLNEWEVQTVLKSVGKLKGSGMRICTDLPPELNARRNLLLAKTKEIRESKSFAFVRLKQNSSSLKLEVRNASNDQWIAYDDVANRETRKHGGISMFVKHELATKIITDFDNLYEEMLFEFILVEIETKSETLFCCVLYRPPCGSPAKFLESLDKLLSSMLKVTLDKPKVEHPERKTRKLDAESIESLRNQLNNINRSPSLDNQDVDQAANYFIQEFEKAFDRACPILSLVEEEKKEELKKLLAYYGKTEGNPTALEYFLKGSEKKIIINSKGNRALPQWFMTASREAAFPAWILRIVCTQEFFYFAQVEELKEPYSLLPAMDIVKGLSAVLLSHDYRNISLEPTNVKVAHLAVQFRSGATIEERNIPFYEGQCVTVPNLEDIPLLPLGTKERFFNQVMKLNDFQSRTIKQFPKDIQMFIGSMIFWNNQTNPSSHQVDALIMMLVVQRSVGKYGHGQNQASDPFAGMEGDPNNTIKNLWNRLDKSDCDLAIKILEDHGCTQKSIAKPKYKVSRYDNAAKSSNACKYYKRTVHKYAEFQMILYFGLEASCFKVFFIDFIDFIGQYKQDHSNETLRNLDDMLMRLKV
ncbi:hypothetical protein QYM36_005486 [Artemia franciscana]|uniref:Uncharacterized protein n=1 Tax=Artemia franciscana TaxID=6661 RepID=A0AA88L471_ARTSF|nr:hypothetical protein QYM36_005486 [Artemia franciscana]